MMGKVCLVGAGPGDEGLITVKGSYYLKNADVVVYDRLVNKNLLSNLKSDVKLIYVGKSAKLHTKTQDEINEILYQEAKNGKNVVRLKGGDPYVFGRGGEEGVYLFDRNIDFEVVPGITSAIGGLAYAGIPITQRDVATSFHVITGHLRDDEEQLDWDALARLKGTLVFLMGVGNLEKITSSLVGNGKSEDTPVAIINWATTGKQKTVDGTLKNIVDLAKKANIKPPSLIAIGEVVGLRNKLDFFETKPLFGKNIVVTREKHAAESTIKKLSDLGANVISFPSIEIKEISPNKKLKDSIENIDKYTFLVFTSVNSVEIFFKRYFQMGKDIRDLAGIKIAAVGPKTEGAIKKHGINVDLIPDKFVGEELADKMEKVLTLDDYVLFPRSKISRSVIMDSLSKKCRIDDIEIYDTVKSVDGNIEALEDLKGVDDYYILFTSSSTFTSFKELLSEDDVLENGKIISIGPITTDTIDKAGYNIYKEAEDYTIDGIINLLLEDEK